MALLGALAPDALAQGAVQVSIAPNAELRVTLVTPPGGRMRGRFLAISGDTLTMTRGDGRATVGVPRSRLQRVEVRGAPDRRRGAVIGAGLLGGIAVVFGGLDYSRDSISGGELTGAIVGNAIIGGLIGAGFAPRRWTPVPGIAAR